MHLLRRVQVRERDVREKRLVPSAGTLDVVGRLPDDQLVQQGTHFQIELADRCGLLALLALPKLGRLDTLALRERVKRRVRSPSCLINAVLVAPPLVEALVIRRPALGLTKMTLAPQRRRVTAFVPG